MGKVMIITGATGYLGQRVVQYAHESGWRAKVIVRPGSDISKMPWAKFKDIDVIEIDLSLDSTETLLMEVMSVLDNETVVIHTAGSLVGNDQFQNEQTIGPTKHLIQAMIKTDLRRLVLISSLSVYGYSALPENSQLDETTPIEPFKCQRDAYCRAKLAQENIAIKAAQIHGLIVTVLRPGAIIGPERLWTSRLGTVNGLFGLLLGQDAILPLSFVSHCAEAVVLAAEQNKITSDVYIPFDDSENYGAFEAINVLEDNLPTQQEYIRMIKEHADFSPKISFYFSWNFIKRIVSIISVIAMVWPGLLIRLPGLLREASLHARIKPLKYSNARLHDRLGWVPRLDCEGAIKQSIRDEF